MQQITEKNIGQVFSEYYDKLTETCDNRRLCEVIAAIYTRVYFDTAIDFFIVRKDKNEEDKRGELYKVIYQEYYDTAKDNYRCYKNEVLIDFFSDIYARAYVKKREKGCSVSESKNYAEGYVSTYVEGYAQGVAEVPAELVMDCIKDPARFDEKILQRLLPFFHIPEKYGLAAFEAIQKKSANSDKKDDSL